MVFAEAQLERMAVMVAELSIDRCTELERIGTTTAGHLEEACRNIVDRYMPRADSDISFQTVAENTNMIDARIRAVMIEIENIQQGAERTRPHKFDLKHLSSHGTSQTLCQ